MSKDWLRAFCKVNGFSAYLQMIACLFRLCHVSCAYFVIHLLLICRANIDEIPFSSVSSSMSKARRAALPKDAKRASEIVAAMKEPYVRHNFGMTLRHQPTNGEEPKTESSIFFRTAFECEEYSFCIFAAEDVIETIKAKTEADNRTLFADGTFKVCPNGQFSQLLIIFADIYGHVSEYFSKQELVKW